MLITLRTQFVANEASQRRHDEQLREQRLFQLIGLMNENALNTKIISAKHADPTLDVYAIGHQAQHHALVKIRNSLARQVRIEIVPPISEYELFGALEAVFKVWRQKYWMSIGLYVDSVFLVFDFILRENASDSFKEFSLRALRVQLSESERLLVWYSAMFTADYAIYLGPLLQSGFIDDHDESLDDQIKPWREQMIANSLIWSNLELKKRAGKV